MDYTGKPLEALFADPQQMRTLVVPGGRRLQVETRKLRSGDASLVGFSLNNTISFFPSKDDYNRVSVTARAKSFLFIKKVMIETSYIHSSTLIIVMIRTSYETIKYIDLTKQYIAHQ